MITRMSLASLGLACWLSAFSQAADKVEILARGPVHEGYAEPSEREPMPTPVIPATPPKAVEELPPDQKPEGGNVQWIPGYWAWDEEKKDFIWVSGFWRNAPPGRAWVPGSWRKTADGWQWSGGFWAGATDNQAEVEYLPKPPAPLDNNGATTPAPSENHVYVPGSWVYRDRYMWRPGFWTEVRPGWVWTSAHYRWTPAGYVFIDGYWDYPLADRGILFAPAYIPPAVYAEPAFVYTPTVVVREECLYGAFFARRGFGAYYFGDYFAPRFASVGFVAWSGHVSASVTLGGFCDPLFSYYSCAYRADPFWGAGVVDLYCGRFRGDYLRPPTTLIQQNTVINNITNNTIVNNNTNTNLNNVTMLTSLNEAGRGGRRNLQTVSETDRRAELEAARNVRALGERRANTESELASRPVAPGAKLNSPRTAKLDVASRPVSPKSGITPKSSALGSGGPGAAGGPGSPGGPTLPKTTGSGGGITPPSPKATVQGNTGPKGPLTPGTPKGPAIQPPGGKGPNTPPTLPPAGKGPIDPVTPKGPAIQPPGSKGPNTPPTLPPAGKGPSTPPSLPPATKGPNVQPPLPKGPQTPVAPKGPSTPPATKGPNVQPPLPKGPQTPVIPKSPVTPPSTRPPVSPPAAPKNVNPLPAPRPPVNPVRPSTPAPKVVPKASVPAIPPVTATPRPPVARGVAPSIPAPRVTPAPAARPPAVARPAPAARPPAVTRPAPAPSRPALPARPATVPKKR